MKRLIGGSKELFAQSLAEVQELLYKSRIAKDLNNQIVLENPS